MFKIIERKARFAAIIIVLAIIACILPGIATEYEASKNGSSHTRTEQSQQAAQEETDFIQTLVDILFEKQ